METALDYLLNLVSAIKRVGTSPTYYGPVFWVTFFETSAEHGSIVLCRYRYLSLVFRVLSFNALSCQLRVVYWSYLNRAKSKARSQLTMSTVEHSP